MHNKTEAAGENELVLRSQVLAFRTKEPHQLAVTAVHTADGSGNAPASIYSDGTYLAANPTWHVEDSPWKARQVLRMLGKHRIRPNSVAEVGCGAGEILRQLSSALPETFFRGFDISEDAIAMARRQETQRVKFFHADIRDSAQCPMCCW